MKTLVFCAVLCVAFSGLAEARGSAHSYSSHSSTTTTKPAKLYSCPGCNTHDHYVPETIRKNGTHVRGHMQSNSNKTRADNFTHKGNVNPYTGKKGTKK